MLLNADYSGVYQSFSIANLQDFPVDAISGGTVDVDFEIQNRSGASHQSPNDMFSVAFFLSDDNNVLTTGDNEPLELLGSSSGLGVNPAFPDDFNSFPVDPVNEEVNDLSKFVYRIGDGDYTYNYQNPLGTPLTIVGNGTIDAPTEGFPWADTVTLDLPADPFETDNEYWVVMWVDWIPDIENDPAKVGEVTEDNELNNFGTNARDRAMLPVPAYDLQATGGVSPFPMTEDFESGTFASHWNAQPDVANDGRIQIQTAQVGADGGLQAVTMDKTDDLTPGVFATNQLILTIDLWDDGSAAVEQNVQLSFYGRDFADEDHDEDNIELSVDGITWFNVDGVGILNPLDDQWRDYTFNLDPALDVIDALLDAGEKQASFSQTLIRFQQYDDSSIDHLAPMDGIGLDNISVHRAPVDSFGIQIVDGSGAPFSGPFYTDIPVIAELTALDELGQEIAGYDETVDLTGLTAQPLHPGLVISEVNINGTDGIEIHNVSGQVLDTGGWKVILGDTDDFALRRVNPVVWELDSAMPVDAVQYRVKDAADADNYWGGNINWTSGVTQSGWAMIVDGNDQVVDLVGWNADADDIVTNWGDGATISYSADGGSTYDQVVDIAPADFQHAAGGIFGTGVGSIQRFGSSDSNLDIDFGWVPPENLGSPNLSLSTPFDDVASEIPLSGSTNLTASFTGPTLTVQFSVTAGTSEMVLQVSDTAAGVGTSGVISFETAPMAKPTVDLADVSDTGKLSDDDLTKLDNSQSNKKLQFIVTDTVPGATVEIYADGIDPGNLIGSVLADSTTTTVTTNGVFDLSDGAHVITARQTTSSTNYNSLFSDDLTVTVDTDGPVATPTFDLQSASDSGVSPSDNYTNVATPTFDVTVGVGQDFRVYDDGVLLDDYMAGTTYTPSLADGVYKLVVRELDAAGNVSPASDELEVTIDTIKPDVPPLPDLLTTSDSGVSDIDNITKDATPSFDITLPPDTYYTFKKYDAGPPRTEVALGETYSTVSPFTLPTQSDGEYEFFLVARDVAGNFAYGPILSVEIDTQAPAQPAAPDLVTGDDSGISDTDNITNVEAPKFDVAVTDYFRFYADGSQVSGDYASGSSYLLATQTDGPHDYSIEEVDVAGNVSLASLALTVEIDTVDPMVDILDIDPDPSLSGVNQIDVQFSEDVLGFDLADLTLTRDGGGNLLSEEPVGGPRDYQLDNMFALTDPEASYSLVLDGAASGIEDIAGNPLDLAGSSLTEEFVVGHGYDWGDAPDSYATLGASGGASHRILADGVFLGTLVDMETDGIPSALADGDDLDVSGDEDGVFFSSTKLLLPGGPAAEVNVLAPNGGMLDAWVDFDGDGTFNEPRDRIFSSVPLTAGVNPLDFSVPADALGAEATGGMTVARFRISTSGGLAANGPADDGEVEDYAIGIQPAAFVGQSGADRFYFDAGEIGGADHRVEYYAGEFFYDPAWVTEFRFDGGDDAAITDRVDITGNSGDDTLAAGMNSSVASGSTYRLSATNFEDVRMGGGAAGNDSAWLGGANGAYFNTFIGRATYGYLQGKASNAGLPGDVAYYFRTDGFDLVQADSSASTVTSKAYFYDSAGAADTFDGGSSVSWLRQESGPVVQTVEFDQVVAYSSGDAGDTARLTGGAGNDHLVARPAQTYLESYSPNKYYNRAVGFQTVVVDVTASGGTDYGTIDDSTGDDTYTASPTSALMEFESGATIDMQGFGNLKAFATSDSGLSGDRAFFTGAASDDMFVANGDGRGGAGYAYLKEYPGQSSYFNWVTGFDYVEASLSDPTSTDKAYLYGTAGNDVFRGYETESEIVFGNGWSAKAAGFNNVRAYALGDAGATGDVAWLYGSEQDDQLTARKNYAYLKSVEADYYNYANGFDSVYADVGSVDGGSGGGDNDTAYMFDADSADMFTAVLNDAVLSKTGTFYNKASYFDRVFGYSDYLGDGDTFDESAGTHTFELNRRGDWETILL